MILHKNKILQLCTFFLSVLLFSATGSELNAGNESWRMLEKATLSFEQGENGEALLFCEKARDLHRAEISSYKNILNKSLLPSEVQHAGDDIMTVYAVLEKRNDSAAVSVLDALLLNHKPEFFAESIRQILIWLDERLVYPEADILTGKIYEAEGENNLALVYYKKAWANKKFLDISDESYTVAYLMADLSYKIENYGGREEYLLLILLNDPVYGKPGEESPTLNAMLRTLQSEQTTDKFFTLYRNTNYKALKAYQDLSSYYYYDSIKRLDRALSVAALASCVSLTYLIEANKRYDFEYVYSGFPDLLKRTGTNATVTKWAHDTKIWDSFLILALVLFDHGDRQQALSLWAAIADYCPDTVAARIAFNTRIVKTQ